MAAGDLRSSRNSILCGGIALEFYEVLIKKAYEQNVSSEDTASLHSHFTWSAFVRWSVLMAGCSALTPDEEAELAYFPTLQCQVWDDKLYDLYEVSVEYIHLYSTRLHDAIVRQGLSSDMKFLEVQVLAKESRVYSETFFAVRYGASMCIPCLRPLYIYRLILEDYGRGHKLYKRQASLLVLDKEKMGSQLRLFRVADVEGKPLVVREDILEQWLEWGIEVDFQEVIVE